MALIPAATITLGAQTPRTAAQIATILLSGLLAHIPLPAATITLSAWNPGTANPPAATITLSGLPPRVTPAATITFTAWPPVAVVTQATITLTGKAAFAFVEPDNADQLPRLAKCRITADGINDIVIPISLFSAVMKYGAASFLSVVIPNFDDYVDAIEALPDLAYLIVDYGYDLGGGESALTELGRVTLDTIRHDRGPTSWSGTLSGYLNDPNPVPKQKALPVPWYISTSTGARRVRLAADVTLRPGDLVTFPDGLQIVCGSITYTIDGNNNQMEIGELTDYQLLTGDVTDLNGDTTPQLPWEGLSSNTSL